MINVVSVLSGLICGVWLRGCLPRVHLKFSFDVAAAEYVFFGVPNLDRP